MKIRVKSTLPQAYSGKTNPVEFNNNGVLSIGLADSRNYPRIFCIDGISSLGRLEGTNQIKFSLNPTEGLNTYPSNGSTSENNYLVSAYIGNTVSSVAGLGYQINLNYVFFPDSVLSIGNNAFYDDVKLSSISLPNNLKYIGTHAFNSCGLTSIDFPDTLKEIKDGSFASNKISTLVLPEGMRSTISHPFNTNPLTSITIPSTLIERSIITDAIYLSAVYLNGPEQTYISLGIGANTSHKHPGDIYFFYGFPQSQLEDQFDPILSTYSIPSTSYVGDIGKIFSGDYKVHVPTALYKKWIDAATWNNISSRIVPYGEYTEITEDEMLLNMDPETTYLVTTKVSPAAMAIYGNTINGETMTISAYDVAQ